MLRGNIQALPAIMLGTMLFAGGVTAGDLFQPLVIGGQTVKWFPREDGRVVLTFAIARDDMTFEGAINCARIRSPRALLEKSAIDGVRFRQALSAAFGTWERAANVSFVEIEDPHKAQIVVGAQVEPEGYAFSNVVPGARISNGFREISRAQVCLNPLRKWKLGFGGDLSIYDLKYTLTHEIGHAIGLDHPTGRGHLMSFRYSEKLDGLSGGDRAGAEYVYGARLQTRQTPDDRDRAAANTHAMAN